MQQVYNVENESWGDDSNATLSPVGAEWARIRDRLAPPSGEVDPLARLFDPAFTDTTWYHEGSKVGDLPGNLHPKQIAALSSPAPHRWLFWGNQVGKSALGAVDVCLMALGRHPLQKTGQTGQLRMPPVTIWASGLTWELWEKVLLPELLSWLPASRVIDAPPAHRQSTKRDIVVRADNGASSRITGKAAEQGADRYQSARVDLVWLDEEHPEAVWDEIQPRLLRFGGRTLATMTPLKGLTWVYARVYEPIKTGVVGMERHWYSHAGLRDNPSITPEARAELLEELKHNPAQLAARDEGLFVRPFGAVLPWDPEKHLVDVIPEKLSEWRKRAQWFGAIDLGKWRFTFQFGPVDHEGVLTLLDEYFSQAESTETRAKTIDALLKRWNVPASISIPADCADPVGIEELNAALERINSPYSVYAIEAGLKAKTAGISRIENMMNRGALKVRRGMGEGMSWKLGMNAGKPGKPVMGSRWMWEATNWQYPKTNDGKIQKDEPDDASADGADFMDGLRYLVMQYYAADVPKKPHVFPTIAERIQREIAALDEPVAAKKYYNTMRQG